jgi:hypothetical protein
VANAAVALPNAEYSAGLLPIPPRRSNTRTTNLGVMNTTHREISRPAVVDRRDRRRQLASAREGAPDGRRRGIFSRHRVGHTAKELTMEPVLNPLLFDDCERLTPSSAERKESRETRTPKRSRAAEYIAALYIALLVCTPWLVRDASLFRPPSSGIEMHLSAAAVPADALKSAAPTSTR